MQMVYPSPLQTPYRVMLPSTPRIAGLRGLRGMGANPSSTTVAGESLNAASIALSTAAGVTPPPASIILAAAAGVAKILQALGIGSGCGQACIQATNIVNNAEQSFLANVQQYESGQITQAQAIATYNNLVQAMTVACQAIPGQPGQDCISDRLDRSSCKWKQTANGDTLGLPGVPAVGECWNWVLGYYAPLTYPPQNAPANAGASSGSVASGSAASSGISSVFSGNSGTLFLIGAALLAAFAFGGKN